MGHLLEARSVDIPTVGDAPVGARIAQAAPSASPSSAVRRDERLRIDHGVVTLTDGIDAQRDPLGPRSLSKALWSALAEPDIGIPPLRGGGAFRRAPIGTRATGRGEAPARGGQELIRIRSEFLQILQMPAPRSLVGGGVELEADHVEAARQPGDEPAVVAPFKASKEARWQAKIEQRLGPKLIQSFASP